jgi:hypothetical protein
MKEFLIETIKFLINNTNCNIMVREHPAKVQTEKLFDFLDYNKILKQEFSQNERLYFVGAADKINTYRQISRSKLILPYTSTVGIDAMLLSKTVLLCTDVYYSVAVPDVCCSSKEEYFDRIKNVLTEGNENAEYTEEQRNKLLLIMALRKYISEQSSFCETDMEWTKYSFDELSNLKIVNHILKTVGENKFFVYENYVDRNR